MLYPLTFTPLFMERLWGGRHLQEHYGKALPPGLPIGESWEMADRPDAVSVIANGPLTGRNLRWLMETHGREILGTTPSLAGRFPLLIKILDAQQDLSLQVHPPAARARELGGDPKTEMWYVAHATPQAKLYVGLKPGVSREEFETKIRTGQVEECFHRIQVKAGDAMFLPSGRVHALGGGNVIFEIQQNSDTTYRVFDWNRLDASGKPRQLHVAESLKSIDFQDFAPSLVSHETIARDGMEIRVLVRDPLFNVDLCHLQPGPAVALAPQAMRLVGVTEGAVQVHSGPGAGTVRLEAGQFCLVPASLNGVTVEALDTTAVFLRVWTE